MASGSPLRWVQSTGGPLVLLSQDLVGAWSGYAGPDYDLACTVDDFLGLAPETEPPRLGPVLVLGDEPMSTTYLAGSKCLVRWNYADSEAGLLAAVRERLVDDEAWDEGVEYDVVASTVLMDASLPGTEAGGEWLDLGLPSGEYDVRTLFFESEHTSAVLHRFTPRFV